MSLADLRKELKELRKTEVRPVSRMKKHEVAMELESRRGGKVVESSSEDEPVVVKKVKKILEKAKVPEEVVEKAVKKGPRLVVQKKKSTKKE
jgi:hypothetical protein